MIATRRWDGGGGTSCGLRVRVCVDSCGGGGGVGCCEAVSREWEVKVGEELGDVSFDGAELPRRRKLLTTTTGGGDGRPSATNSQKKVRVRDDQR